MLLIHFLYSKYINFYTLLDYTSELVILSSLLIIILSLLISIELTKSRVYDEFTLFINIFNTLIFFT